MPDVIHQLLNPSGEGQIHTKPIITHLTIDMRAAATQRNGATCASGVTFQNKKTDFVLSLSFSLSYTLLEAT